MSLTKFEIKCLISRRKYRCYSCTFVKLLTIIIHIENWFWITPPHIIIRFSVWLWLERKAITSKSRCESIFRLCRFFYGDTAGMWHCKKFNKYNNFFFSGRSICQIESWEQNGNTWYLWICKHRYKITERLWYPSWK